MSLLPNRQAVDESLSTYKLEHQPEKKASSRVKLILEKYRGLHTALLILVLLGTCMVIGDGLLTPAISGRFLSISLSSNSNFRPSWFVYQLTGNCPCQFVVFSAVSGLEFFMSKEHHQCKLLSLFSVYCLNLLLRTLWRVDGRPKIMKQTSSLLK